ncbi:MAG: hypothetical protein Q4G25_02540 [Paracoccus sp. (in: a-proteobacteria)]|nr:hypothetical protein [Paracoccus sp. (in: a-proteobacteria)]
MRLVTTILAGVVLGVAAVYVLLWFAGGQMRERLVDSFVPGPPDKARDLPPERVHFPFLAGIDFDAGPVMVAIDPGASDAGPLLIRDHTLLRAHRDSALLADTGADERVTIIGALFGAERGAAIRIWQNDRLLKRHMCFAPRCARDPVTQQSLAPLIAAAVPIITHDDSFDDYGAYKSAWQAAMDNPELIPPRQQMLGQARQPNLVALDLPAGIIAAGSETDTRAMTQWRDASARALSDHFGPELHVEEVISYTRPVMMRNICTGADLGYLDGVEAMTPTLRLQVSDEVLARMLESDWSFFAPLPVPVADPVALGAAAFPRLRQGCLGFAADLPALPVMGEAIRRAYRLHYETAAP